MSRSDHMRYRQALKLLLASCDHRFLPADEPEPQPDENEWAAACHDFYVAECDRDLRWETREAARRALARLDKGTFGRCADCGQPISPGRLAVMPWADYCVHCQSEREGIAQLPRAA